MKYNLEIKSSLSKFYKNIRLNFFYSKSIYYYLLIFFIYYVLFLWHVKIKILILVVIIS